jgi:DNA topoisomerase-2
MKSSKKSKSGKEDLLGAEDEYKQKTPHEHVLDLPDTYIGSVEKDNELMFINNDNYDDEGDEPMVVEESIEYVSGYFKIFDEIIVNARDHSTRKEKKCKNIKINIKKDIGEITVWNDGEGIPIVKRSDADVYTPEFIFARLLTSSNYDKKGKTTGGKNGYGAKLANIYSVEFEVKTIGRYLDKNGKVKLAEYTQLFENNMYKIHKPVINYNIDQKSKQYTQIRYIPDYKRFNMDGLSSDMYNLLIRRCYDLGACTSKSVSVKVNGKDVKCRDFKDYIKLYYSDNEKVKLTYEKVNSRWEIGAVFNPDKGDRCISFANGINTYRGGTHEHHVINNVVQKVIRYINSQKKYEKLKISPAVVKQYLTFFVNCVIEDPKFSSQTKEYLESKVASWTISNHKDAKCNFSDEFVESLCKSGLQKTVVELTEFKESKGLSKTDGKKVGRLSDVEKLIDAEWAGKRNSNQCYLFLTEGDSARAFAVSGLGVIGSQRYGVFPLRGKLLNVRSAAPKQIMGNKEFNNLKKILGLKQGEKYTDKSKLRYGGIVILTDQDADGFHIKGLIINMLEHFWPELLLMDGFIKTLNTPLLKVWKKSDKKRKNINKFYSVREFDEWKSKNKIDMSKYNSKYYKGLGTSSDKEAKECFEDFDKKLVSFYWEHVKKELDNNSDSDSEIDISDKEDDIMDFDKEDKEDKKTKKTIVTKKASNDKTKEIFDSESHIAIAKAFDKKKVAERKKWIRSYDKTKTLEYDSSLTEVSYSDFIDKELIEFSVLDNERSLPNLMDGLKPSTRKIIFACFERGRSKGEIKVSQLAGYVSEHTDYHHGEKSLMDAIIGLAQNYPCSSNNINLLKPNGNFGYRRNMGKDHASARYIFTELESITSKIFREEDFELLEYHYDDGKRVEPKFYVPIIPMSLINGGEGIGTGFSSKIPPHNPRDVIMNIKRLLNDKKPLEMVPWFQGFKGTIERKQSNIYDDDSVDMSKDDLSFVVTGKYEMNSNKIHITEFPSNYGSIDNYEKYLESKISVAKDDNNILEDVTFNRSNNFLDVTAKFKMQELRKLMKKSNGIDKFLKIKMNMSIKNIHLFDHNEHLRKYDSTIHVLQEYYKIRLNFYHKRKEFYLKKLRNELNIYKYKVKFIKEYMNGTIKLNKVKKAKIIEQLVDGKYPKLSNDHRNPVEKRTYQYLTGMSIMTLSEEEIDELEKKSKNCQEIYDEYENITVKEIWEKELDELLISYKEWEKKWSIEMESEKQVKVKGKKKSKAKKRIK